MSNGLNWSFRQGMFCNPINYLRNNRLATNPHVTWTQGTLEGPHRVNLSLVGAEINVENTGAAGMPAPNPHSRAFSAYWVRNLTNGTGTATLGNGARYMFTPALTGCLLEITPAAGGVTVSHCDASLRPLPAIEQNLLKGGRVGHRWWDNGDDYASVVVGVRGLSGWRFYRQSYNYGQTTPLPAAQVSEI